MPRPSRRLTAWFGPVDLGFVHVAVDESSSSFFCTRGICVGSPFGKRASRPFHSMPYPNRRLRARPLPPSKAPRARVAKGPLGNNLPIAPRRTPALSAASGKVALQNSDPRDQRAPIHTWSGIEPLRSHLPEHENGKARFARRRRPIFVYGKGRKGVRGGPSCKAKGLPSALDSRLSLFDVAAKRTLVTNDNRPTTSDSQFGEDLPFGRALRERALCNRRQRRNGRHGPVVRSRVFAPPLNEARG